MQKLNHKGVRLYVYRRDFNQNIFTSSNYDAGLKYTIGGRSRDRKHYGRGGTAKCR